MDSALPSKAYVQDQRVFHPEDEEHTTAYYGGEVYSANGLYVVSPPSGPRGVDPATGGSMVPTISGGVVNDNYGYLPSPPPVPGPPHSRYLYPENAGHLV